MKIGAIFPTTEIGNDPSAIRDWAQAAEDLGYSYILLYDHVLGAERHDRDPEFFGPYGENDPFHEVFVTMGYLAAATSTIGLATGVLILPQRQTALAAKQAAEVQVLSEGRLRLGVGSGWNYVEYESLGVEFRGRGKLFTEQVELMRQLWAEPVLDYTGRFHRVDRAGILPRPSSAIPIWFGGFSEPAFRRAARLGDGFIYASRPSLMAPMHTRMKEHLESCGRDASSFGAEAMVDFSAGPEVWEPELERWRQEAGTHLALRAMDTGAEFIGERHHGYAGPDDYIDALRVFMATAAPYCAQEGTAAAPR